MSTLVATVDCPFSLLLFPVRSEFVIVTEFPPSITTASDVPAVRVESATVISAVEYIAGDPTPPVVPVILSAVTVPPPLSVRMAADEFPDVSIVTFDAVRLAPPVVISPPELLPVVVMVESVIVKLVPLP